jgi:hypothetical protein
MTSDFSDFVEEIADHIDPDTTNKIEELLYKDNQGDGDTDFDIYSIVGGK